LTTATEQTTQRRVADANADTRERATLPLDFLEWQSRSRIELFRTMSTRGASAVKAMPAHLAVLGSHGPDGAINLAAKGIGMVPIPEKLRHFTTLFRRTVDSCSKSDGSETVRERMETLLSFYMDVQNFDDSRLGGLEIFEGETYSNLSKDPRVSLLFAGEPPSFNSYQVDGVVEFVRPPDPYFGFLRATREMFAMDPFHVPQRNYRHGFIVHVSQVRDKRPFTRE
jgi:hypothetical protein